MRVDEDECESKRTRSDDRRGYEHFADRRVDATVRVPCHIAQTWPFVRLQFIDDVREVSRRGKVLVLITNRVDFVGGRRDIDKTIFATMKKADEHRFARSATMFVNSKQASEKASVIAAAPLTSIADSP